MAALIRETLEGVVTPARASAILLEALSDIGRDAVPNERPSLEAFVEGSLAPRLRESIGDGAEPVLATLSMFIDRAFGPEPARPSQIPTSNRRLAEGPVRLLVVSSTASLCRRVRSALGEDMVSAYYGPAREVCARIMAGLRPPIVVVDATEPFPFEPLQIAESLRAPDALVVVWGTEGERGSTLHDRLAAAGSRVIGLDSRSGAEPLMDDILCSYVPAPEARTVRPSPS